jgi:hypothetical protein
MPNSSNTVRVQLRAEDRNKIDKIATQFSCIYGGKPSLSVLLSEIANGRIQVTAINHPDKQKQEGVVIQLVLSVPFYFKGIIYLIADKVSSSNGNILELNTTELINPNINPNRREICGMVNLLVQISSHKQIHGLLKSLDSILLEDLRKFNPDKKGEIDNLQFQYSLHQQSYYTRKSSGDVSLSEIKLVVDTKCTLGLTVKIANKPGILSEITKTIAEEKILVSHLRVRRDEINKKVGFMDLHLFFDPSSQKDRKGLENIESIKNSILGINGVENITDLDVLLLPMANVANKSDVYFS